MTQNTRNFKGSISVRIGTNRTKLELSPAETHGGEPGLFRVRIDRRWLDTPEGDLLLFDRSALTEFILSQVLDEVKQLPATPPELPIKSRVSILYWHDDEPRRESNWTSTPPIRGYDGNFYVGVMTAVAGFMFIPVENVTRRANHGK